MKKLTIDFTKKQIESTDEFSVKAKDCSYYSPNKCWAIDRVNGEFAFTLVLSKPEPVVLLLTLLSGDWNGVTKCPVEIGVNGTAMLQSFDPGLQKFYDLPLHIPAVLLKSGGNAITLKLTGGNTRVFIRGAVVTGCHIPDKNSWMSNLSDNIDLSDINIPGTHDAAAINPMYHTLYACHNATISEQLTGGIRLLDVRIKVKKSSGVYEFATCHGNILSSTGANEYQSLRSLMQECKDFLNYNPKETIIMTLKVDDWTNYESSRTAVLNSLESFLRDYPICSVNSAKTMPLLGTARGKIILFNRINSETRFGFPISWTDATSGSYADSSANRNFAVYVQDKYKGLPMLGSEAEKLSLVKAVFQKKKSKEPAFNFASATWYGIIGVYIMRGLLEYFGKSSASARANTLGWILLDYEFSEYQTDKYGKLTAVDLIIASNFDYRPYSDKFEVVD